MTESSKELSALSEWVNEAVTKYERPLLQYAVRLTGDPDRAGDVVQDTFLKLWRADRASVNGHLAQWLYRVCRNRALDIRRKEKRITLVQHDQLDGVSKEHTEHEHEGLPGILAAIAMLPEKQQEVIRLKFQGGLSYQEIANVMEITANHVGVLIHNAIKTIREKLNAQPSTGVTTSEVTS